MNRIDRCFLSLKKEGRAALVAYVTGGFPSIKAMDDIVADLVDAGVDILEVGIPFSDPIADGPVIQSASQRALEKGVTLSDVLDWVRRFRRTRQTPVVLMSYMNPLTGRGEADFARRAREAGVDGVIVPDLIIEEGAALEKALEREGVHLIYLVAPTTPPARRTVVARRSKGFLYVVSLTGVTGARRELPSSLGSFLRDVRRRSPVPVAVGFGISTPAQARRVARWADGVIVGSALVGRIADRAPVAPFIARLRNALDKGRAWKNTIRTPRGGGGRHGG